MFPWSRKKDTRYYLEKGCENFGNAVKTAFESAADHIDDDSTRKYAHHSIKKECREISQTWSSLKKSFSKGVCNTVGNSLEAAFMSAADFMQKPGRSHGYDNEYHDARNSFNYDKYRVISPRTTPNVSPPGNSDNLNHAIFYSGLFTLLVGMAHVWGERTMSVKSFTILLAGLGMTGFSMKTNNEKSDASPAPAYR
jgi:hypothetical protein